MDELNKLADELISEYSPQIIQFNSLVTCSNSGCSRIATNICDKCKVCYHCSPMCVIEDYASKHRYLCGKLSKYYQDAKAILPEITNKFPLINTLLKKDKDLLKLSKERKIWVEAVVAFHSLENLKVGEVQEKKMFIGVNHLPGIEFKLPEGMEKLPKEFLCDQKSFPWGKMEGDILFIVRIAGSIPLLGGNRFGRSLGFQVKF